MQNSRGHTHTHTQSVSVCACVCAATCLSYCLPVSLSVCVCVSVCLCLCLCLCLCVSVSLCLCVSASLSFIAPTRSICVFLFDWCPTIDNLPAITTCLHAGQPARCSRGPIAQHPRRLCPYTRRRIKQVCLRHVAAFPALATAHANFP